MNNEVGFSHFPSDKVLYRKQVQRELDDIRQEAENAYALDNAIDPVDMIDLIITCRN